MISLPKESFAGLWGQNFPSEFLLRLDRMFSQLIDRSGTIPFTVRSFIDATAGAVIYYLPDGTTQTDKDYQVIKIDASVNAVTVTAYGTQKINGSATLSLAAQYDKCWLGWCAATSRWIKLV